MCSIRAVKIRTVPSPKVPEKPGFPKSKPQKPSSFFLYVKDGGAFHWNLALFSFETKPNQIIYNMKDHELTIILVSKKMRFYSIIGMKRSIFTSHKIADIFTDYGQQCVVLFQTK